MPENVEEPPSDLWPDDEAATKPTPKPKINGANGHTVPIDSPSDGIWSDDALALAFSARYGRSHRYVAVWGHWLRWDGQRWAKDETLSVFDLARHITRDAAALINRPAKRKEILAAKTVASIERLARADRVHAAEPRDFDSEPWALNTPGGIIDLRTGNLAKHDPERHFTKITAVAPAGPGTDAPIWRAFVDQVTCGDSELALYLNRVLGYGLTGLTRDHAMFFLYGTGGNGKGVFLNTVRAILGDYATVAPIDTFTASNQRQHPTELAGLRGARLVITQETEEGSRWAESRVKAITGGDPISARFMRQDFFEYIPEFKLIIAGNHKPGLRSVDAAIRRRMNLIPFALNLSETDQDEHLPEKLKAEWPAILRLIIDGCREWQGEGLQPPEIVRTATDEYLGAQDSLSAWMEECCTVKSGFSDTSATLFNSWRRWAKDAEEFVMSQRRFSETLESRGFEKTRIGHSQSRGFKGIAVRVQASQEEESYYGR